MAYCGFQAFGGEGRKPKKNKRQTPLERSLTNLVTVLLCIELLVIGWFWLGWQYLGW